MVIRWNGISENVRKFNFVCLFVGKVSVETVEKVLKTDIPDYVKQYNKPNEKLNEAKEKQKQKYEVQEKRIHFYLGKQELRRKNISDVMEALLGSYLEVIMMSFIVRAMI